MSGPVVASGKIESFVAALVEAGADLPFRAEDLLFWNVPAWIVAAYAQARLSRREVGHALAVAAIGETDAALCQADPQLMIWTLARAWTTRLGELERKARGRAEVAA